METLFSIQQVTAILRANYPYCAQCFYDDNKKFGESVTSEVIRKWLLNYFPYESGNRVHNVVMRQIAEGRYA